MLHLLTTLRANNAPHVVAGRLPWDDVPEAEDGVEQLDPRRQLMAWRQEFALVAQDVDRRVGLLGKHGMTMGALAGCYLGVQVLLGYARNGGTLEQALSEVALVVTGAAVVGALLQRWRCAAVAATLQPHYRHIGSIRDGLRARATPRIPRELELLQSIDEVLREMSKLGGSRLADPA